jgi:hypothetical protein
MILICGNEYWYLLDRLFLGQDEHYHPPNQNTVVVLPLLPSLLWIYTRPFGKTRPLFSITSLLVSLPEDSFLLCIVVVGPRSFVHLNYIRTMQLSLLPRRINRSCAISEALWILPAILNT